MNLLNAGMVFSAFVLSLALVAAVLHIARRMSWYDRIDERKIHKGNIPRLGGVGFSLAFLVISVAVIWFFPPAIGRRRFLPVIMAMVIILCTGVRDDFRSLSPNVKLVFQIVAALLVVVPGFVFRHLFLSGAGALPWWISYPLTVVWLVGMPNALNFIDGVDGLCGGISMWISIAYGAVFLKMPAGPEAALLSFCLAAVLLGFLAYNLPLPKVRIFMGDGGAYFLGFVLALITLIGNGPGSASFPLLYAAALLLLPILDVIAAVWRRVRDGRRWDMPDRSHIHHKLMNMGFKTPGIDGILWTLQIILGILVYAAVGVPCGKSVPALGAAYLAATGFFAAVHFLNRRAVPGIRKNGEEKAEDDPDLP